jgi:hypothetical protein
MSYERKLDAALRTEGMLPDIFNIWVRIAGSVVISKVPFDPLSIRYWIECAFQDSSLLKIPANRALHRVG